MMCLAEPLLGIMLIPLKKDAPDASIRGLTFCRFKHDLLMNRWLLFINVVITSVVIVGVSKFYGDISLHNYSCLMNLCLRFLLNLKQYQNKNLNCYKFWQRFICWNCQLKYANITFSSFTH
jgi:hypothetical protein